MGNLPLKGKRILITAGPTWVRIDDVRVISNISSGELGCLLAEEAFRSGARADVLLGPVTYAGPVRAHRVIRFRDFDELLKRVSEVLSSESYDIILHCAAVSDYVIKPVDGKISSRQKSLVLHLTPAPKIVEMMRRLHPHAFLVMFKLENRVSDAVLLKRALEAKKRVAADLVVANRFQGGQYRGFILGSKDILAKTESKKTLTKALFRILKEKL